MRAYSQLDEENIRDRDLVRDWIRSRLLNAGQESALQQQLPVSLRRTNVVLRIVLFLFTALIVVASVGLSLVVFEVPSRAMPGPLAAWALICFALAWLLAKRARLYRCGVEEAFGVASVILLMLSIGWTDWTFANPLSFAAGALASLAIYSLFGFRYAIVAAALLAGANPFVWSPFGFGFSPRIDSVHARVLSVLILALIFQVAREMRRRQSREFSGEDWAVVQVATFGACYFVLNVIVSAGTLGFFNVTSGWFYWCSYVLIWILPPLALWMGIRERDRLMMDGGGIAVLVTLATNKSYLGLMHQTWDPLLLGVLLIGSAVALKRWLAKGNNGERYGFTPNRLLESENRALAVASAVSLALPHTPAPTSTEAASYKPGGGRSGGAGASGEF